MNGETVVAYRSQPDSWKPMLVFGCWFVATGIGGFLLLPLLLKIFLAFSAELYYTEQTHAGVMEW